MVVLIVSWGLKKKKKVLGRPPIQNPIWIYWTQIHTVVCTMYFLSFVTQLLPLRLFGSFPSPMSPNCLLKRMLCMVTSNVQVQPSCWPQGLTALPGWNTLGVVGLKSFFLFFFFWEGGRGKTQMQGQVVLVLNLEKALLYCSMFILHLKRHITAEALLLNMCSQLPFMRHLS